MKSLNKVSFIITLLIHALVLAGFKLLDNFNLIISVYILSLISGFLLNFFLKSRIKEIGWGLFYGSISAIVFVGGFMIWLESNYPK